ncbi:MAG TPA: ATP-binding protein [Stellaceae bacterium]|nr:ATP-binding protein [Stellaceae bacterium]
MSVDRLSLNPDVGEIPRLIDWIELCCDQAGISSDFSFQLLLALDEAVTNVIGHAFTGQPPPYRIAIELEITDPSVVATVIDNGRAFDPSAAPEPDLSLPLEDRDPGGLGIMLIHRMVDRVEYRRAGDENRLRLEKSRS